MLSSPNHAHRLAWAVAIVAIALTFAACSWHSDAPAAPAGPMTQPAATQPSTQPIAIEPADNSYCLTCHLNMQFEEMAVKHQDKGVGCVSCHGESSSHSSDENGITPPDVMFPRGAVNPACVMCHPTERLKKDPSHKPLLVLRTPATRPWCTSCHGEHAVKIRTRRWDKITGKLIYDDGVRMVEP